MTIKPKTFTIGALLCAMLAVSAEAQPVPVIEPEPLPEPPEEIGAWYLRGDIAYVIHSEPNVYFDEDVARQRFGYADIDDTARIGVGVGRRFGDWFRSDLTLDYAVESGLAGGTPGPCGPASCATVERVDLSTLSLMLNGYASLGYFSGISPYVGAGVGFSYLNWDYRAGLDNRSNDDVRFAYALMAGVGYDINSNWTVDAGYRFFNVPKGNIADDNAALNGDIRFEDLMSHEFRLGLRYTFGDFVN